jgi:hypothetical protein
MNDLNQFLNIQPKPNLIFFTQKEKFHHRYLLYKINRKTTLEELRNLSSNYTEIFIDPDVYSLKKSNEFPEVNKLHELANISLPSNVFLSIDYPCDMNSNYSEEFIIKSVENNRRYAKNPNYICTIQFKYMNFDDFCYRFNELRDVWIQLNKIIGIGNLCRLIKTKSEIEFGKRIMRFLAENIHGRRIHIYGLGKRLIGSKEFQYLCRINRISIDSTKWTQAVTSELKKQHGLKCKSNNRELFFNTYIFEIKNKFEVLF